MDRSEKYIARIMFRNKVFSSDGVEFQNLFVKIMQKANKSFKPVKPHGKIGDRKNDGFDDTTGVYYQVYAPEDIKKVEHSKVLKKLKNDFQGLKDYWDSICSIKKFYFVINDKYKGVYPEIYKTLSELKQVYRDIEFEPFLAKDIEDIFMDLSPCDMDTILGHIPSSEKMETVDYSIMTEVTDFLLDKQKVYQLEEDYVAPDFDEKIKFNNLSEQVELLLNTGSYQVSVLDEFFEFKSSNYAKKELRDEFKSLYEEADGKIPEYDNKSDSMFFYILEKASVHNTKQVQDAVLVLMAYYFETCDIFTTTEKGTP